MGIAARVLVGFVVAAASTPAGVSGAFLLLPVQVQVFNVPSPAVSATNLLYNVVSAPAGAVTYQRLGRLDTRLAMVTAVVTSPAPAVRSIGSRSTATFALADLAGIGHADAPRWLEGAALGVGGLAGAIVGARIQPRIPVRALKVVLALAAIAAGVRAFP